MSNFRAIKKCRICGGDEFESVISLGDQVLTGVFPSSKDEVVASGPVDLVRCSKERGCGLVQLKQSYDTSTMYGMNYGYRSSLNASMSQHLENKVNNILKKNILDDGDIVIDIGSNDATTLKAYPENIYNLIGVDPTGIKFEAYYPDNIKLVKDFFGADQVGPILNGKKAKVITSFSMFYDLEDPINFAKEVESLLHDDGIWVLEQSYLPAMLETNSFDTICHEHLEFYALSQIEWIMKRVGLRVIDVELNNINGGSFSIEVVKKNSLHISNNAALQKTRLNESKLGLEDGSAFIKFRKDVDIARKDLLEFLIKAKEDGKSVAGLGASTKGNVLLQYFNINYELLPFIGEVNQEKFGCYTPGTKIPIIREREVIEKKPDYLLILPWHFKDFFISNQKFRGLTLILPLPKLHLIRL